MSEAMEQDAAVEQPPVAPVTEPEAIDDAVFDDLYRQTQGQEPQGASTEPPAEVPPIAEQQQTGELEAMKQELATYKGAIAAMTATQGQPAPKEDVAVDVTAAIREKIIADNPGIEPGVVDVLINTAESIADAKVSQSVAQTVRPLTDKVERLEGHIAMNANDRTQADFESTMNGLSDQAGISDDFTRRTMRNSVVAEGMKRHGESFDMDKARSLYAEINNERLRSSHQANQQYVEAKQTQTNNTPPQQHGQSGGGLSGVESLQKQIRDPSNKKWDFRGGDLQENVLKFLGAVDRGVDGAMSGRQ